MTGIGFPAEHPIHAKVRAYTEERQRQEQALEEATGNYGADKTDYFARGGKPLITFKDWLKGTSISPGEEAARNEPVSHDYYQAPEGSDYQPPW